MMMLMESDDENRASRGKSQTRAKSRSVVNGKDGKEKKYTKKKKFKLTVDEGARKYRAENTTEARNCRCSWKKIVSLTITADMRLERERGMSSEERRWEIYWPYKG